MQSSQTLIDPESESIWETQSEPESNHGSGDESEIDPELDHLSLQCLDEEQRFCVVCRANPFPELAIQHVSKEDLRIVQMLREEEACALMQLVETNVLGPSRCISAAHSECDEDSHRRENLIVLCQPHARLFKSRNFPAASLVFVPYTDEIMVLVDEELKERERHSKWKAGSALRAEEVFQFRRVDEICRDRNFPQSYICMITRRGHLPVAFDVRLHIPPLVPIEAFNNTYAAMPDVLGFRGCVYPRNTGRALSELQSLCADLTSDWVNRRNDQGSLGVSALVYNDTLTASEKRNRLFLHKLRSEWKAGNLLVGQRRSAVEHLRGISSVYNESQ